MEAKLDRYRTTCIVEGVREENSYFESKCTALETVDWSTLKVSTIIIWKEPLAKILVISMV
jgi:hypothetical protein